MRTVSPIRSDARLVPPGSWTIDPAASSIVFTVRNFGRRIRGHFGAVHGTLGGEPLAVASVAVASVETGIARRDAHLKSPDFFDAERYPELTLVAYRAMPQPDGGFKVDAALSIKGDTHPLALEVERHGLDGDRFSFTATGRLHRYEFGVKAPQWVLEAGGVVIGREIGLELELVANRSGL